MEESDSRDVEFEAKVSLQCEQGSPYEAFQFAQSYLARRYSPTTALTVREKLLLAVGLFISTNCALQGGHLLTWYLEQNNYWKDLSRESMTGLMSSVTALLNESEASQSGIFADAVHQKVMEIISADTRKGAMRKVNESVATGLALSLGNALTRVGQWEQALYLFVYAKDMENVAMALHNWAQSGPRNEYPLFFARMLLTLLSKKRLVDASSLAQHAVRYTADFENSSTSTTECVQSGCSLSAYHFSTMLTELLNLGTTISAKEKSDIFALLMKKYSPVLEHPDKQLLSITETVSQSYGLKRVVIADKKGAMIKNTPAGGGLDAFAPMLRRHFNGSSKK